MLHLLGCLVVFAMPVQVNPNEVISRGIVAEQSASTDAGGQNSSDVFARGYRPNKHDAIPIMSAPAEKPTRAQIATILQLYAKKLKNTYFDLNKFGHKPVVGTVLKSRVGNSAGFVGILFHHPEQRESMRSMIVLFRPRIPERFVLTNAKVLAGTSRTLVIDGSYMYESTFVPEPVDGVMHVDELRNLQPRAVGSYELTLTPVNKADKSTASVKIGKRMVILKITYAPV